MFFSSLLPSHPPYHLFDQTSTGVGGWNSEGIDPSLYSRTLAEGCQRAVIAPSPLGLFARCNPIDQGVRFNPMEILRRGYLLTHFREVIGSSTACILSVGARTNRPAGSDGILEVANLGDSGFLILRRRRTTTDSNTPSTTRSSSSNYGVVYKNEPQQTYFNCPYQLGYHPSSPGGHCGTIPENADWTQQPIHCGDVIVSGTLPHYIVFIPLSI